MVLSKDMKIAISFGLIMGALISICNMCFAAEDVSYLTADNILLRTDTKSLVSSTGSTLYYVEIEPGYVYTLTNNFDMSLSCGFFNDVVPGTSVDVFEVDAHSFKTFTANDIKFLYVGRSTSGSYIPTITREPMEGMTGFIDNLAYDLSYANLSGVLFFVVPIMAIAILVGLGFYLLKRLLNKIKRAKGGA